MSSPFQQFFLRITADAPPAPDPEMYLPHPALADLSDCSVTVDGILLPLHSQILSAQAALLHGLFASRMEGMSAGEVRGWQRAYCLDARMIAACAGP